MATWEKRIKGCCLIFSVFTATICCCLRGWGKSGECHLPHMAFNNSCVSCSATSTLCTAKHSWASLGRLVGVPPTKITTRAHKQVTAGHWQMCENALTSISQREATECMSKIQRNRPGSPQDCCPKRRLRSMLIKTTLLSLKILSTNEQGSIKAYGKRSLWRVWK